MQKFKFSQLILNPVENIPYIFDEDDHEITGYYISDKPKTDESVKESIIGFSGRELHNKKILEIYDMWASKLSVSKFSLRLLSGLHAHIVLFMGIGYIGDSVLLLPEIAGGHYATKNILNRLGYNVLEMIPDFSKLCVDISATKEIIERYKPKFIFVDRSEGINYEDFTPLLRGIKHECCAIFDASQYLTNILTEDFISPFDMGFQIMLSSTHKNFPGPQKALICSRYDDKYWNLVSKALSDYVSNLHPHGIYLAGNIIKKEKLLHEYSRLMLENSIILENELLKRGLPVIAKDINKLPTHHIWLKCHSKDFAFKIYKNLEECNILTNYRLLPYNHGYGLRIGTSAGTLQGLNSSNIPELASIIKVIYNEEIVSEESKRQSIQFINNLIPLTEKFNS